MNYIVLNIGCVECGVSSNIVGIFNKEKAEKISRILNKVHDWREGGQNIYEKYPMPSLNTIHEEYKNIKELKEVL